jgi:putative flippase GtrA
MPTREKHVIRNVLSIGSLRGTSVHWRGCEPFAQFVKYATVGASGYVINLAVFAIAFDAGGLDHRAAAVLAFLVAVLNNFLLNRTWTFAASGGRVRVQARRFFTASLAAFFAALGVLDLLVGAGVQPVVAQAISIIVTTPISFTVNKAWSFRHAFE